MLRCQCRRTSLARTGLFSKDRKGFSCVRHVVMAFHLQMQTLAPARQLCHSTPPPPSSSPALQPQLTRLGMPWNCPRACTAGHARGAPSWKGSSAGPTCCGVPQIVPGCWILRLLLQHLNSQRRGGMHKDWLRPGRAALWLLGSSCYCPVQHSALGSDLSCCHPCVLPEAWLQPLCPSATIQLHLQLGRAAGAGSSRAHCCCTHRLVICNCFRKAAQSLQHHSPAGAQWTQLQACALCAPFVHSQAAMRVSRR